MGDRKIKNMEQFAEVSGISRPTVSKYFHDPESVRKSTRGKIEAALEEYDYRPNIFAINQNRKLTKTIGVVVPYLSDPFFAEIARNIERRCIDAGFSLKPAGVLLAPLGRESDRLFIEKFCRDVPTVLFDSNLEGLGAAFVGSDNYSFVSQSVNYLVRSGDPPTFFEMRNPANPNANKRRNAYLDVMESLGLKPNIIQIEGEGWDFEKIGYQGALRLLASDELTSDTVLCSNDRLAIGFLAAAFEKGVRVGLGPECTMRVASHDDHPFSQFTCPSLTTVGHDYERVSNHSVEALFKLIQNDGEFDERTERIFPAHLILRASA